MKYFTKYLPVPGEIKKGDLWKEAGSDHLHYGQLEATLKKANEAGHKKVKQFLCSRDIQVGDLVFVPDQEEAGNVVDGEDLKYWKSKNAYKEIGEVSPAAIWVKEGMEFDENDIQYWLEMSGVWFRFNKPKVNGLVRFKCPTCNTFH